MSQVNDNLLAMNRNITGFEQSLNDVLPMCNQVIDRIHNRQSSIITSKDSDILEEMIIWLNNTRQRSTMMCQFEMTTLFNDVTMKTIEFKTLLNRRIDIHNRLDSYIKTIDDIHHKNIEHFINTVMN